MKSTLHTLRGRVALRHADGLWPNGVALAYGFGGWALGLGLCASADPWWNMLGVLLLSHGLVISAYLLHECAHNTIFAEARHNARLGAALAWHTGACYSPYEALRHKHFRHHVDNADVVALDHRRWLRRHPVAARLIAFCEWCYLPALDVLMHALAIVVPLRERRADLPRRRVLWLLAVRGALFAALAWYSLKALLLYAVAYALFLHVMRFFDVHQHTYDVYETGAGAEPDPALRNDRQYEQGHTYSNLISVRHPWLNLLALNFPYHNAHHARPTAPWYRLPQLHRELHGADYAQVLPFANLLRSYHRYRVARIVGIENDGPDRSAARGREFVGALGVSFLVAH